MRSQACEDTSALLLSSGFISKSIGVLKDTSDTLREPQGERRDEKENCPFMLSLPDLSEAEGSRHSEPF